MIPDHYVTAERTAAALVRGLGSPGGSWGELIATAETIIGHFQEYEPREQPLSSLYLEGAVVPLIAAARILDAASQWSDHIAAAVSTPLALEAAVAFAMYGNFASATATLKRHLGQTSSIAAAPLVLGTCAPSLIGNALSATPARPLQTKYLEELNFFLQTGQPSSPLALRTLLVNALAECDSSFDGSLLRSSLVALQHAEELCTVRALTSALPGLDPAYVRHLATTVPTLLPPQYRAVTQSNLVDGTENALISLPTSTGKTLLAELCLVSGLRAEPGLVVYIAPYVALGRQVATSIRRHVPPGYRVHTLLGGFRSSFGLAPEAHKEIVVSTPEAIDGLLREHPALLRHLRTVIADEAHLIQNGARGARLEGIVTRLQLSRSTGGRTRIVLLSAVLSDLTAFQRWLDIPDTCVVVDSWRPTTRRLASWKQSGWLVWHQGDDPVRTSTSAETDVVGKRLLPWPDVAIRPSDRPAAVRAQEPMVFRNVAFLAELIHRQFEGPVLCACGTKAGTRQVAHAVAARFYEESPLAPELERIVQVINREYPHLGALAAVVRRGVAYHNSTVPHRIRHLIEDAIAAQKLRVVAATTTLAEGVDLPFRATLLVDWLLWSGGSQQPMSPLTFRNIAGRCGRAGLFTEGDTILFDNPLGNQAFASPGVRDFYQAALLRPPPPLTSALAEPNKDDILAVLGSQILAAIPENPNNPTLLDDFLSHSYAERSQAQALPHLRESGRRLVEEILDDTAGALARAASPLHLTALGRAAALTGFSPASCRHLLATLRGLARPAGFPQIAAELLRSCATLPEQTEQHLRKTVGNSRSRFCVKPSDFEAVLGQWLTGTPAIEIFGSLPYVQRSKRQPFAEGRGSGVLSESWAAELDKFVDFVAGALESYLPWVLRACGALSGAVGGWTAEFDWQGTAHLIEQNSSDPVRAGELPVDGSP